MAKECFAALSTVEKFYYRELKRLMLTPERKQSGTPRCYVPRGAAACRPQQPPQPMQGMTLPRCLLAPDTEAGKARSNVLSREFWLRPPRVATLPTIEFRRPHLAALRRY